MLTILTIEDRFNANRESFLHKFALNSLIVRQYSDAFEIRHINYINRNGRINWHKISKTAIRGERFVLYSGDTELPADLGVKKFEPSALRQRLCTNMALSVLSLMKEVPQSLRIGLYDPYGEYADLTEHLLKFTDNLVVVTKNSKVYLQQSQRLLEDMGAVLCVSSRVNMLSACGLIISPVMLEEGFTLSSKTVILSCHKPKVSLGCRVYYMYSFRLPLELDRLKPELLSSEVFAGALYSLCGEYTLGSLIPLVCTCETDSQTALSLRRYLCETFST